VSKDSRIANLPIGYFGASTGAAAALVAAAKRPERIRAVVSRGGRPDLAEDHLGNVTAPTLLIVGEFDRDVIELNRKATEAMRTPNEIRIVPGATHLFEEEGALEEVAALAREWFFEESRSTASCVNTSIGIETDMKSQIVFKTLLIILLILLAAPLLGALAMMATGVAETSFLKERRVVTNVMLSPCGPNLVGTFTGLTRSVSIVFKRTAHRLTYIRPRTSCSICARAWPFHASRKQGPVLP
jgi:Dienelactone hydrolase family